MIELDKNRLNFLRKQARSYYESGELSEDKFYEIMGNYELLEMGILCIRENLYDSQKRYGIYFTRIRKMLCNNVLEIKKSLLTTDYEKSFEKLLGYLYQIPANVFTIYKGLIEKEHRPFYIEEDLATIESMTDFCAFCVINLAKNDVNSFVNNYLKANKESINNHPNKYNWIKNIFERTKTIDTNAILETLNKGITNRLKIMEHFSNIFSNLDCLDEKSISLVNSVIIRALTSNNGTLIIDFLKSQGDTMTRWSNKNNETKIGDNRFFVDDFSSDYSTSSYRTICGYVSPTLLKFVNDKNETGLKYFGGVFLKYMMQVFGDGYLSYFMNQNIKYDDIFTKKEILEEGNPIQTLKDRLNELLHSFDSFKTEATKSIQELRDETYSSISELQSLIDFLSGTEYDDYINPWPREDTWNDPTPWKIDIIGAIPNPSPAARAIASGGYGIH